MERQQLFSEILKGVSRSFYLTLRVLPQHIREPIAVAYLLARAADTLADTNALAEDERLHYLLCFQGYIVAPETVVACDEIQRVLQGEFNNPDEGKLLEMLPQLFSLFAALDSRDKRLVKQVVSTLCSGMVFDLQTFPKEGSGDTQALKSFADFDHYTYQVAGCVGEFWTEISMQHTALLKGWNRQYYSELGIQFGKALQYTNILRDLPRDLRIGRCYLPQTWLHENNLNIEQLLEGERSKATDALLRQGVKQSLEYFDSAEQYILAIPRRCIRLRLAALWPLMIGLASLKRLIDAPNWLDVNTIIKVDRRWVYSMLCRSLFVIHSNHALQYWIKSLKPRVD